MALNDDTWLDSEEKWSSSSNEEEEDKKPEMPELKRPTLSERLKQRREEAEIEAKQPKKYLEDEITYSNWQIGLMILLGLLMAYVIYEYEYMHVCALRFYANMGDKDAQHILAQRYYLGKGVPRNKTLAFYWFKEAAKQGHGHASYNLGVAHIQGFHRLERKGEAHELIKHAANLGIKEAQHVLKTACAKGECDR